MQSFPVYNRKVDNVPSRWAYSVDVVLVFMLRLFSQQPLSERESMSICLKEVTKLTRMILPGALATAYLGRHFGNLKSLRGSCWKDRSLEKREVMISLEDPI